MIPAWCGDLTEFTAVETARHTLSFTKSVNLSVLIFPASFSLVTLEKWSSVPPFHWQGTLNRSVVNSDV